MDDIPTVHSTSHKALVTVTAAVHPSDCCHISCYVSCKNPSFSAPTVCFLLVFQSWDVFFRNANAGAPPGAAYQSPLSLSGLAVPQLSSLVGAQPNVEKLVEDHLAVQSLIRAYQVRPRTGLLT